MYGWSAARGGGRLVGHTPLAETEKRSGCKHDRGPASDGKPELDGLSATRSIAPHYDAELSEGETGPRSLGGQMYELPVDTTSFAHREME